MAWTRCAQYGSWRYNDARSLVSWGRMLQLRKADPKEILEQYFNGAKKADSGYIEAYIASAELALEKQDAALAAEYLAPAIKLEPEHPELNYLLAQAFVSSDPERADAGAQAGDSRQSAACRVPADGGGELD